MPLQPQQVCNVCIVYMSACEQCCRLCNNSIPFKVYNEKFRGGTYITVFDGIHQFLTTLRNTCNGKGTLLYLEHETRLTICDHPKKLPMIAGDPVTVVKICCDYVDFCRIWSNMVSYTVLQLHPPYTWSQSCVAALKTVLLE